MSDLLGKPIESAVDGENNPIAFDFAYPLRGPVGEAIQRLRERHGENIYLIPISGGSCGGGIMQVEAPADGKVIGLRFDPPVEPRIRIDVSTRLADIEQDEIFVDRERLRIRAGAAITLAQLNQALQTELGPAFRVPGADLTSYQYAAVGATFMTGGMGPQRRYFSDSVTAAAIYDGTTTNVIDGNSLTGYAGTYGWSGLVTAVECQYFEFPPNEIAFTLPVSDDPGALARILDRFGPFTVISLDNGTVRNPDGESSLILGIEHVSCDSMQPLLDQRTSSPASHRALDLRQKCAQAGADGLLFVNGLSSDSVDDFLLKLVDDSNTDDLSIAGIALEHAELFPDAEEMRDLREAIPYAARMQTPPCQYLYKNHSDAVIRILPGKEAVVMTELWRINRDYISRVETYIAGHDGLYGAILVYGHLNPQGVDPHNRVTLGCDDSEIFKNARDQLIDFRAQYYRSLSELCMTGDASLIGGEKTADSEIEIYAALNGPEHAPRSLYARFQQQRRVVQTAAPMFNWRAPTIYR